MIKNRNLKMGLIVLVITLIGLIAFAKLHPEEGIDIINNHYEKAENNTQDNLDIAKH